MMRVRRDWKNVTRSSNFRSGKSESLDELSGGDEEVEKQIFSARFLNHKPTKAIHTFASEWYKSLWGQMEKNGRWQWISKVRALVGVQYLWRSEYAPEIFTVNTLLGHNLDCDGLIESYIAFDRPRGSSSRANFGVHKWNQRRLMLIGWLHSGLFAVLLDTLDVHNCDDLWTLKSGWVSCLLLVSLRMRLAGRLIDALWHAW